jgi:DNA-binding NarL/FixJ family response regulator
MDKKQARGVKVFLVDDHPAMRRGLSIILAQVGHTVCGEAGSRKEMLDRIDDSEAEVALVDLSLSKESGLDLLSDLLDRNIAPLVYSMHEDRATIERAFARGAHGYVTKREVAEVLLEALDEVFAGRRYGSPLVSRTLASGVLSTELGTTAALSPREEQIMVGLGHGESSSEIGGKLGISAHTVGTYYARIIEKLELRGMKELRKVAIKRHSS